jgi:predicted nucleic acid-binding protein
MIVVDTNAIACLVINSEFSGMAVRVLKKDPNWACPVHWESELSSILSLYIRKGTLTLSQAQERMAFAIDLIGQRSMAISYKIVLGLAAQSACSSYDCEFVALAQALSVSLVTNDRQILDEFPGTAVSLSAFAGWL